MLLIVSISTPLLMPVEALEFSTPVIIERLHLTSQAVKHSSQSCDFVTSMQPLYCAFL